MVQQRITLKARETLGLEEVTWDQVRGTVRKINPLLADIIDEFDPSNKYTFLRARYPYGVDIRRRGVAYFPTEK